MEQAWQFACSSNEGEAFQIGGLNVWEQGWQVVPGQEARINDPVYGQEFIFRVFAIQDGEDKLEFAAGEFSNGVWGFYVRE
jgi:hypothetical protein